MHTHTELVFGVCVCACVCTTTTRQWRRAGYAAQTILDVVSIYRRIFLAGWGCVYMVYSTQVESRTFGFSREQYRLCALSFPRIQIQYIQYNMKEFD